MLASWRRDAERSGLRREEALEKLVAKLGLARRVETGELELRVAQLEHRVKLLESSSGANAGPD